MEHDPNADNIDLFECRLCPNLLWAEACEDGPQREGWARIENIDGPCNVCPDCVFEEGSLDALREDHPNARFVFV